MSGLLAGSRLGALMLGPPLHLAADRVPHQDVASRRFEIVSGSLCSARSLSATARSIR